MNKDKIIHGTDRGQRTFFAISILVGIWILLYGFNFYLPGELPIDLRFATLLLVMVIIFIYLFNLYRQRFIITEDSIILKGGFNFIGVRKITLNSIGLITLETLRYNGVRHRENTAVLTFYYSPGFRIFVLPVSGFGEIGVRAILKELYTSAQHAKIDVDYGNIKMSREPKLQLEKELIDRAVQEHKKEIKKMKIMSVLKFILVSLSIILYSFVFFIFY
jgi:hypothetical protein